MQLEIKTEGVDFVVSRAPQPKELFPRRICLRVSAKSHVGMVLGDQAYDRGAWANRITDTEAGVGYVFGEGIREPLRIRAGWVPDQTIKHLETFVTNPRTQDTAVLALSTPSNGSTHGARYDHPHPHHWRYLRAGSGPARDSPR